MLKELSERLTISENGRQRKITKREALIKQVINKAVAGNPRIIQILFNQIPILEDRFEESRAATCEPPPLPPGIVNLFEGAFRIIEEHGANPPDMDPNGRCTVAREERGCTDDSAGERDEYE